MKKKLIIFLILTILPLLNHYVYGTTDTTLTIAQPSKTGNIPTNNDNAILIQDANWLGTETVSMSNGTYSRLSSSGGIAINFPDNNKHPALIKVENITVFKDTVNNWNWDTSISAAGTVGNHINGNWEIDQATLFSENTAGNAYCIFAPRNDGDWMISNSTIETGDSSAGMACINAYGKSTGDWTISNSTIKTGKAVAVTGIDAQRAEGDWTIANSTIKTGETVGSNYGISTFFSTGAWTISNSSIETDEAGGGNYGIPALGFTGDWTITNSTVKTEGSGLSNSCISPFFSTGAWTLSNSTIKTGETTSENNYGIYTQVGIAADLIFTLKGNTSITSGPAPAAGKISYAIYAQKSLPEQTIFNFGSSDASDPDNNKTLSITSGVGQAGSYAIDGPDQVNVYMQSDIHGDCQNITTLNLYRGTFSLNSTHTVASGEFVIFHLDDSAGPFYELGDSSVITFAGGSHFVTIGGDNNTLYSLIRTNSGGEAKIGSWTTATSNLSFPASYYVLDDQGLWIIPPGVYTKSFGSIENLYETLHGTQLMAFNFLERLDCYCGPYIQGLGGRSHQEELSSGYGYDNTLWGIQTGYNFCIPTEKATHRVGVGYGYLHDGRKFFGDSVAFNKKDTTDQAHHFFSLYGSQNRKVYQKPMYLNYLLMGGISSYKNHRIDDLTDRFDAHYHGYVFHANIEGSYLFLSLKNTAKKTLDAGPWIGIQYNHIHQDSYKETSLTNSPNIGGVHGLQENFIHTILGMRAQGKINLSKRSFISPYVTIGWMYEALRDHKKVRASLRGVTYTAIVAYPKRSICSVNVGSRFLINDKFALSFDYQGFFKSKYCINEGSATFSVCF